MDNTQKNSGAIACSECDTPLAPDELTLGATVECPSCGTTSEIVAVDPIKLAPLEEEK